MTPTGLIPCSQCGYESPDNAKFCRSCGAPLIPETESSAAGTRHYGRQDAVGPQPISAPLPSQPLPPNVPPSIVDAFGDETRRQTYVPPVSSVSNTNPFATPPVPQYNYTPPVPQYGYAPPPVSKRRRILKWGLAASALAVAMGIGAAMNESENNARISSAERALIEDARREGRLNDNLIRGFEDARGRTDRDINDRIRQIERAREEARRAAERGGKTDIPGLPLLDLDKYEFEQAAISSAIRIPGKEMRQQFVDSDFGYLVQHYEKLLGKPIILQNSEDDDDKRALFQSPATPEQASVSLLIKHSNKDEGQWEILVLRSPFNFQRPGVSTVTLPAAPPPPLAPVAEAVTVPNGKVSVGNAPATESAKPAPKPVRQ